MKEQCCTVKPQKFLSCSTQNKIKRWAMNYIYIYIDMNWARKLFRDDREESQKQRVFCILCNMIICNIPSVFSVCETFGCLLIILLRRNPLNHTACCFAFGVKTQKSWKPSENCLCKCTQLLLHVSCRLLRVCRFKPRHRIRRYRNALVQSVYFLENTYSAIESKATFPSPQNSNTSQKVGAHPLRVLRILKTQAHVVF